MRAVFIGATVAFAGQTMADPDAQLGQAMGKFMLPGNQIPGLTRSPSSVTRMTPTADVSMTVAQEDMGKLEEANAKLEAEIANLRGWVQTAKMAPEQEIVTGDEVETPFDARPFGLGVASSLLVGLAYKVFFKGSRDKPSTSMGDASGAELSSAPTKTEPLLAGVTGHALFPTAPAARLRTAGATMQMSDSIDDTTVLVQGGSLRTWSYPSPVVDQVQVVLGTEGRPLDADVELWHGPDNTPVKMRVYVEDGALRPFSAVIETPRGPNTVAVRNIGQIEFPIAANVFAGNIDIPSPECISSATTVQGGALRTYPFDPTVDSVQVLLNTDGRPLNARIELLQGPNNNKEVIELYTEDGCDRPFFCILETPGAGNVVRIVNTAPVEFPMTAGVVPNSINEDMSYGAVLGGEVGGRARAGGVRMSLVDEPSTPTKPDWRPLLAGVKGHALCRTASATSSRAAAPKMMVEETQAALSTLETISSTVAAQAGDFGGYTIPIIGLGLLAGTIALLAGPVDDE